MGGGPLKRDAMLGGRTCGSPRLGGCEEEEEGEVARRVTESVHEGGHLGVVALFDGGTGVSDRDGQRGKEMRGSVVSTTASVI